MSDVAVVGDENDRLKISAETREGTQVEEELSVAEVGRAMSQLGITDARDLEGQPALAWEEDDGSTHLEFESRLE